MEQQLDFLKCYYRPSFFHMKIDLPVDLGNLNEITDATFGLYLHEYIHFVQDISTIYGLMNISTINYYIQYCAHKIYNDNKKSFEVPISLVEKPDVKDYGVSNFNLRPIYIGSPIKEKSKSISNFSYSLEQFEYEPSKFIEKVIIQFVDDNTGNKRNLEFGGNQVTEGMAYLCEQFHHSEILPDADAYPYKIVEEIVSYEYPEIVENKVLLITICDAALMSYHPGLSFIRIIKHLKQSLIHQSNEDLVTIYKSCTYLIKGSHVDFEVLADNVCNEIKKNFNTFYFDDIKTWVVTIFDRIKKFRSEVPNFINDIVVFGKPKENKFFAYFLNLVGSPLVLDGDNNGTISLPSGFNPTSEHFSPAVFMAINQVLRVFYKSTPSSCELVSFCKQSQKQDPKIIVDDNCTKAPWLKANDKDLCLFAQIWHHWALKEYAPKYN